MRKNIQDQAYNKETMKYLQKTEISIVVTKRSTGYKGGFHLPNWHQSNVY